MLHNRLATGYGKTVFKTGWSLRPNGPPPWEMEAFWVTAKGWIERAEGTVREPKCISGAEMADLVVISFLGPALLD